MKNLLIILFLALALSGCEKDNEIDKIIEGDCESDIVNLWVRVNDWKNCDGVDYYWGETVGSGIGGPVIIKVNELNNYCGSTYATKYELFSQSNQKIEFKAGWCLGIDLTWRDCSPVFPNVGGPVSIAVYADADGMDQVWPLNGVPAIVWPEKYHGTGNPDLSYYDSSTDIYETLENICK